MRSMLLMAVLALALPALPALGAAEQASDVRVLIDISGSMRQNDPHNLRRPALRMLVGLLQPGTQAGVWTFARWVNMLVPHGEVDAAWKQRAMSLSEQIASPGQFTNIEEVLERATRSWQGVAPTESRPLVLRTDGMVDVAQDPAENAASRARILSQLLPRVQAAEARIHAIALSDRADHELLRELTAATDGWYQQVASADELQRVFLRIFDKVGQPEGVPLEGNRFQVDRSIREATVLVFRGADAPPTRLHAPDGSAFEDSDLTAGVAWHKDQGYDLITIADPAVGEWRLEADSDPDNRVMIVTDLKLETSELPNRLAVGESVPFAMHLSNKGQIIDRPAFLDLVQIRAEYSAADGPATHALNDLGQADDEQAGDGRYSTRIGGEAARGEIELSVVAESNTFVRQKRLLFTVTEPAELRVVAADAAPHAELAVDSAVLPEVAAVELWQDDPQGGRVALTLVAGPDGVWTAPLTDPAWPVRASVEGQTRAGNLLAKTLGPVYAPGVEPAADPPAEPAPEASPAAASASAVPPEVAAEDAAPAEPAAESGWLLPGLIIGGVNLLLIAGGLTWWLLRRRRKDATVVLLGDEPTDALDATTDITREEAA
ncbi:MAG: hypothetical protein RLZ44_1094 [Pseudomonadota bacterium]